MKVRDEMTADKLRGGFYSPESLVSVCLDRAAALLGDLHEVNVLEPSVGDGAFIRGLAQSPLRSRVRSFLGLEPLEIEAEKARSALRATGFDGHVLVESALAWSADSAEASWDLAVGNPPFLRYQFVSAADQEATARLAARRGLSFRGVSNLWIPVLLAALTRLREGGVFAFVLPTECFTGCAATVVRDWLRREVTNIHFDLFAPGSFPNVLQEVAVLSGTRSKSSSSRATVAITEHGSSGGADSWAHDVSDSANWTRYLLDPVHLSAIEAAAAAPQMRTMQELASFEVSIVTGANAFFCVTDEMLEAFSLDPWAEPLLPRIRHAEGLIYGESDFEQTRARGARCWLLDFDPARGDPRQVRDPDRYLDEGERLGLPSRYKCRIRTPWYRVPGIRTGDLLLSKRSHDYPRVVRNEAKVFTTDTIYRGRVLPSSGSNASDVAACFHNSATLLSAELEGRSFGGGVLEMVPSEIQRLLVPHAPGFGSQLTLLDGVARTAVAADALIEKTNELLVADGILEPGVLQTLEEARQILLGRRLARNRRVDAEVLWEEGEAVSAA